MKAGLDSRAVRGREDEVGWGEASGIQAVETKAEKESGGRRPGWVEEEAVGASPTPLQATTCSLRHQGPGSWGTVHGW